MIPFVRIAGEQLRERNIYVSWIPVRRTVPPQELEDHQICHRFVHHDIEWCDILLDPPAAFHPRPALVTYSDEDPPNDPGPEPPGPGWYERAQYTRTDFGPHCAGNYVYHTGWYGDRGGRVLALAHSPCGLHYHTAVNEREHRARLAYVHCVLLTLAVVPRTVLAADVHRLFAPVIVYVGDVAHGPAPPSSSTTPMERRAASLYLGASANDEATTVANDDDSCDSDSTGGPPPLVDV